ncbi:pyridoxamine 5-phosphate oxidase [Bacillus sp. LL01]|uniref:pyridoxamine 5'-phosphate oxidase family protein n=1 Tax=Bacillus sp. LL01 TaxID=1665556 RepID=UPI00064D0316|nr:pyridoxamine 5'-phosphate oxidase family protein [Bacillus sp. LL01]KMJ59863.1 pyridoxamine 5-phosphate oxidase [Bacillus sp. LL01]
MKIIRDKNRSFELDEMLNKPLFAHLATVQDDTPKDSPVWFHWGNNELWIIGTASDTFPKRIQHNPKCAIGIVDFDSTTGKVLHAGFRGTGTVERFDPDIAYKIISKYLGIDETKWDRRFQNLDASNVLINFKPVTVVVRDQSYEK